MKVAIMQPYLFPYIGYFQLIHAVDVFVIYDNIQYTKKGWINRNRILMNGKEEYFTVPLKKDSDFLDVRQRFLADSFEKDKLKLLSKFKEAYRKAPFFPVVYPMIELTFESGKSNLFDVIFDALKQVCSYLGIDTKILVSSEIDIDHNLRGQDKVIAIAHKLNATEYINAIGGVDLYEKDDFNAEQVQLQFIRSNNIVYKQFDTNFIPWLSIIDVMMFNPKEKIMEFLTDVSYQ